MQDPLGEVLRSIRLVGGIFLDVQLTSPWSVLSQIEPEDVRPLLAAPVQLISYHCVTKGRMLVTSGNEPQIEIRAGEVVLLPRNDPHVIFSGPGMPTLSGRELIQPSPDGGLARVRHGGGGEATHLICGFLGSENLYNPLLDSLPRILKLDVRDGASREWVEASVRFAAGELAEGRLATSSIMSRLSELLLVEAVRNYAQSLGGRQTGWLRGLADPQIGNALALMHRDVAKAWTAEELAKQAAMSRSSFVERFTALVGVPPIRYLTLWRLNAAKASLRETRMTMAQLSHSIGYESEEAFSRAFKREFGTPPARWRAQSAIAASASAH